jgi:LPXTG-motif cell wall-anchored protein
MKTNGRRIHTWSAAFGFALLAMTIGTAQAAIPSTTAHHFSSHPMISGTVVAVNDHQMVVDTDQGEQLTLEMDSRTMAPRDLAPGMVMRAEFLALEDCRLYAQRILPVRAGMSTERTQAYANTRDSRQAAAGSTVPYGVDRREHLPPGAENRVSAPQVMERPSSGNVMTAPPATRDHSFSSRPMLSGRVLSVNDHSLVLETEQGRKVAMTMDSRTMVPAEVGPETYVRAEFEHMKDGRFYANRVSWIGDGIAAREQAYAHTRDGDYLVAQNVPDCGYVSAAPSKAVSSAVQPGEPVAAAAPATGQTTPAMLPQTASRQPLLLLLGLLALASAGLLSALRRTRNV